MLFRNLRILSIASLDKGKFISVLWIFLIVGFSGTTQNLEYLHKQAYKLSSDYMNGRGYVDDGLEKAAGYIHHQFDSLGLRSFEKDYCQKFKFAVNTFPHELLVSLDHKELIPGSDFLIDPQSGSSSGVFEPLYFNADNLKDLPEPGRLIIPGKKIVLVLDATNIAEDDEIRFMEYHKMGHADHLPVIWLTEKKLTWSVSNISKKNAIVILKKELYQADTKFIELEIKNKFIEKYEAMNLSSYVKGNQEPDSFIVFTAHYDHLGKMGENAVFDGGNDNASGCAFLLELARHYSKNQNKYSMVFIAFAGEEAGLIGSKYFTENPLFELDRIKFLINMDLMGYGDEGITVVNGTLFESEFKMLTQINKEDSLLTKVKIRGPAANSDHYWFTQKGVPSFFIYTMGGSSAYHDVYDVYENLTFIEFDDIFKLITTFVKRLD